MQIDSDGNAVDFSDKNACRWCLAGAITYICPDTSEIIEVYNCLSDLIESQSISIYNDNLKEKHSDIINLLDTAIKSV